MPQSLVKIIIHSIFSTKERYPFLQENRIRQSMHSYMAELFNKREASALLVGGTADHVHILHLLPKNETISQLIGEVKRASSIWVKHEDKMLDKFQWQRGYGSFSVSQSSVKTVKKYINNQLKHHQRITFQDELREFFKKYKIDYDEKYVWD